MARKGISKEKGVKINFNLEQSKQEALDAIASLMERDRSYLLNEAANAYLTMHEWQLKDLRHSLQEAEKADFASEAEVATVLKTIYQMQIRWLKGTLKNLEQAVSH